MAAILLSATTVSQTTVDGWKTVKIITDATADDGDTIDLSSLFEVGCTCTVSSAVDGTLLANDQFTDRLVTLPGATDNQIWTIVAHGH